MGPGTEALTLGSGWDNISLVRIMTDPIHALTRFHMADGTDPTKRIRWELSDITTGTTRAISCPNWDGRIMLPMDDGTDDYFLKSNGTNVQPEWAAPATVAGLIQHDLVLHSKPFAVANCSWANGSLIIETATANGFANVKVGDYVYLGDNTGTLNQGRRVTTINSTTNISVDATNGNSSLNTITIIFQPGDHWDDTLALDNGTGGGLLSTLGRGTYNTSFTSGTHQEIRGPLRWMSHNDGNLPSRAIFQGCGVAASPEGFGVFNSSSGHVAYIVTSSLTGNTWFTLPATGGNILTEGSTANAVTNKHFTGANIIDSDGTTARAVFQNAGGSNFLAFEASGNTLRKITWPDIAGNGVVRNAAADATGQPALIATTTLATAPAVGMYRISGFMNCTSAGAGNAVLQIDWTDDTARTAVTVCTLDKGATNYAEGSVVIYVGSGNVSYNVTYAGTGTYTARVRMEAI